MGQRATDEDTHKRFSSTMSNKLVKHDDADQLPGMEMGSHWASLQLSKAVA